MDNKPLKELGEIKELIKEPKHDYIEKFSTISDDTKSLLIRIPQEIRKHFKMNAGDKIKFYAEFREEERPKLEISWVKKND